MKNWQLVTLIGLFASSISCSNHNQKYQSRESIGFHQTTKSIENEKRRSNDDLFHKSVERINWDNW